MDKKYFFIFILSVYFSKVNGYVHLDWDPSNPALDNSLYGNALDPELCQQQLTYIRSNTLLTIQFIESGMRIPRGILMGNTLDWGNYFQCLSIDNSEGPSHIEGKYCSITVPFNQSLTLPELPTVSPLPDWVDFDPRKLNVDAETMKKLNSIRPMSKAVRVLNGEDIRSDVPEAGFTLAVCIPKSCTTKEGIDGLLFNLTDFGFKFNENQCRLNNDKPWTPSDYVAIFIFSFLGLLTLLSTSFELWHTFVIKSDPKSINIFLRSFSLYTNTRRLTTFTTSPGALECVDGIRALSMMWVILGHSFTTLPSRVNLIDSLNWTLSLESIWVTAGTISVDTFFTISGLLLVYTTSGKMTGSKLLKNLHVFYLNRLLRMFPLLAAGIILQMSILHRISDGPHWELVVSHTENCRNYWWTTLLYLQNFLNPRSMCLPHSWYLAIDMQMYIICPLVLYWVLGKNKNVAWSALLAGLLAVLTASAIYIFFGEFPGSVIAPARDDHSYYMTYYYVNTWCRASPFLVGMIFGYILHLWRDRPVALSKPAVALLWFLVSSILLLVVFSSHPMKDLSWDNQIYDSFVNTFHRPIWAIGIGLMVFVCHHGYGGPVNWLLSLQLWKLPSRLSYGMYIFHYPIMYVTAGSAVQPIFFTVASTLYRYLSETAIAVLVAFVLTLFIDSPFSTLFKILLGGGPKKAPPKPEETKNENSDLEKSTWSQKRPNGYNNNIIAKHSLGRLRVR